MVNYGQKVAGFVSVAGLVVALLFIFHPSVARADAEQLFQNQAASQENSPASLDEALKAAQAASSENAVMIIRFNQKYVYFEQALKKVVYKVAAAKHDAKYELQSIVPSKRTNSANSNSYDTNLRNVIGILNKYKVSSDRITSSTVVSDTAQYQEIDIFVR